MTDQVQFILLSAKSEGFSLSYLQLNSSCSLQFTDNFPPLVLAWLREPLRLCTCFSIFVHASFPRRTPEAKFPVTQ